jgi:hypothetical protein
MLMVKVELKIFSNKKGEFDWELNLTINELIKDIKFKG